MGNAIHWSDCILYAVACKEFFYTNDTADINFFMSGLAHEILRKIASFWGIQSIEWVWCVIKSMLELYRPAGRRLFLAFVKTGKLIIVVLAEMYP